MFEKIQVFHDLKMLLDKVILLVRNEINDIAEAGRTGHDMHMESFEPRKR